MATRADHYRWADELVWKARRQAEELVRGDSLHTLDRIRIDLMAAQVHAALASVPDDVERQEIDRQREEHRAVVRAEEGRSRVRGGILGVGDTPAVVESPAYGTEPSDEQMREDGACWCGLPRSDIPSPEVHPQGVAGCLFDVWGDKR